MRAFFFLPLLLTTPALAAEPTSGVPPLAVTVYPGGYESLTVPSATAAQKTLNNIPGSTALIESQTYEQSRASTIKDILDFTPGVFAQPRYGEESRLSIRGSGLSRTFHLRGIRLIQDGIPLNLADGGADFQEIDPLAFDYTEVYKGANAMPYGVAALGGAVNFITPSGHRSSPAQLRIEGGSFGTERLFASTGGASGAWDGHMSLTSLESDGFRENNRQENIRFFGNTGYRIAPNAETRFYLSLADINQEIPGNLTKSQMDSDPKQAAFINKRDHYQRDFQTLRLANKTTVTLGDWTLEGGLYATTKDLFHPIFQVIDQQSEDMGIFSRTSYAHQDGGKTQLWLHANQGTTDSLRYTNQLGYPGTLTHSAEEQSRNIEASLEHRQPITQQWTLIGGGLGTIATRDYEDRIKNDANGDRSGSKTYHGLSPRLGAEWAFAPSQELYGNISHSYEPPTFSELTQSIPGVTGLADIDAQQANTAELGWRGQHGRFEWDASIHYSLLQDELITYSLGGGSSGTVNAGDTFHRGLDLGGTLHLTDALSLRLAYTWLDARFDNDTTYGDNPLPGAPEHYLRTELRYDHPAGWFLAPNLEWVPQGYAIDFANTLESDPYALLNLRTGYQITEQLSFFVDARNLTNEIYASTTGVIIDATAPGARLDQFTPGDGRALYAGLTWKW